MKNYYFRTAAHAHLFQGFCPLFWLVNTSTVTKFWHTCTWISKLTRQLLLSQVIYQWRNSHIANLLENSSTYAVEILDGVPVLFCWMKLCTSIVKGNGIHENIDVDKYILVKQCISIFMSKFFVSFLLFNISTVQYVSLRFSSLYRNACYTLLPVRRELLPFWA